MNVGWMQAVELRSRLQREIAAKEKEAKERELRDLAMRARMDRVGGGAHAPAASRGAGTAAAGDLPDPLTHQSVQRILSHMREENSAAQ